MATTLQSQILAGDISRKEPRRILAPPCRSRPKTKGNQQGVSAPYVRGEVRFWYESLSSAGVWTGFDTLWRR